MKIFYTITIALLLLCGLGVICYVLYNTEYPPLPGTKEIQQIYYGKTINSDIIRGGLLRNDITKVETDKNIVYIGGIVSVPLGSETYLIEMNGGIYYFRMAGINEKFLVYR